MGPFTAAFNAHNRATLELMKVDGANDDKNTVVVATPTYGTYL